LGIAGVRQLLGVGRKDESGDFSKGAGLNEEQVSRIISFLETAIGEVTKANEGKYFSKDFKKASDEDFYLIDDLMSSFHNNTKMMEGLNELMSIHQIIRAAGYGRDRMRFDLAVVRGLEYYTGPVFECELLTEVKDGDGRLVRFGSVGGGGRYDDLVARFTGQSVPATGFSIGVSRLYSALKLLGKTEDRESTAPVVVLVMDKERQGDYQKMVQQLRGNGIRAEMYVGTSGMKAQMKYADKRGSPLVVIQGGDEKAKGEVTLKDLALGSELASSVESREEYASQRLAQVSVAEADLVKAVKEMLGRGR
jgi:histidyl-tRNA synthetase